MKDTDLPEFAEAWNDTLELKGQKPISDRAIAMAFDILSVYSLEQILGALGKFLTNPDDGQYHLQPSALIKMIEGDSKTAANKAWMDVRRIATSCGGGDDIVLHDLVAMKCIDDMGGLQRLTEHGCEFDLKDYGREFKVMYESYRIGGISNPVKILKGKNNTERARFGLPAIAPRMIGFETSNRVKLPDMSKPRYEQIESTEKVSALEVMENMKNNGLYSKWVSERGEQDDR